VDAAKLDNSHCFMVIDATSRLFLTHFYFLIFVSESDAVATAVTLLADLPFQQMLRLP